MLAANVRLLFGCRFGLLRQRRNAHVTDFSNESRSFDTTRNAVRFWGHDASMEVSFFVTHDALRMLAAERALSESASFETFDAHRAKIDATAGKVYGRGRKGSYELVRSAF